MRVAPFPIIAILVALVSLASPPAWAAPPQTDAFVKRLADQVLTIFNDERLPFPEQEQRMHAVAVRDFDVPYSARFVLGPYWRTASEKERADFSKAYENYIVHVYAGQFRLHHDADFRILSQRPESPTQTLVRSEIVRHDGRPPIRVGWRVITEGETLKIIDVSVEGISQLVSLREQFTELMEHDSGGVPMLTEQLRQKSVQ